MFYLIETPHQLAQLEEKLTEDIKIRLQKRLKTDYWKERFDFFDLKIEHVIEQKFPTHIVSGGIPKQYEGDMKRFCFPEKTIS